MTSRRDTTSNQRWNNVGIYNVKQRRINVVYFNADVSNVRQRRNNVVLYDVEFHNVGQRGNNAVKMIISKKFAFRANNIKLYHPRWCCSCVTHFGSIFPFMPPENIKNLWFFYVSKGYKKLTLTSSGLLLVAYRNYKVLWSFCFENYWLGK